MEISSDIPLKGSDWNYAIEKLSDIFKTRTHYSVFMLSLAIGIMYDQRICIIEENQENIKSVPRSIIANHDNGTLDFYFQASILSTLTEDLSEENRLELAFGEKTEFNKVAYLLSFANFGVKKITELIGVSTIETMFNIKDFLEKCIK